MKSQIKKSGLFYFHFKSIGKIQNGIDELFISELDAHLAQQHLLIHSPDGQLLTHSKSRG